MAPSLIASLLYMLPMVAAVPSHPMSKRLVEILTNADAPDIIPNKYIAVYNSSFSDEEIDACQQAFTLKIKKRNLFKRSSDGEPLSTDVSTYSMGGWRAMAFDGDAEMVAEMNDADEVEYIEADHWLKTNDVDQSVNGDAKEVVSDSDDVVSDSAEVVKQFEAPSSLVRVSHNETDKGNFTFDASAGQGITVYVVDTGIKTSHAEFEGRAIMGATCLSRNGCVEGGKGDDNGHGSHVAGTVGGATVGAAKAANLIGVKVLDAQGRGPNQAILNGLQFVAQDVQKRKIAGKAVMNMSLGGSFSPALNSMIAKLSQAGVVPVVAAGNEHNNANGTSPASAKGVITVGAIVDTNDQGASFTNFGPNIDVWAPGVNITSVDFRTKNGFKQLSGTSMASPLTAGVVATIMSGHPNLTTVEDVRAQLKVNAAKTGAEAKGVTVRVGNEVVESTTDILNNGVFDAPSSS